jgi:hypothetical protein
MRIERRENADPGGMEVTGGWTQLDSEGLHNMCSSENVIWATNSRRMRWAGHAVCMGKIRKLNNIKSEDLNGRE